MAENKGYRTVYFTLGSFIKEIFKDAPRYKNIKYTKQWIDIYYVTGQAEQDEADFGKNTYIKPLYVHISEPNSYRAIYRKELEEILRAHNVDSLRVPEKLRPDVGLNTLRITNWHDQQSEKCESVYTKRTQTQEYPLPNIAEILIHKYVENMEY
jgi:hypothetical protein